ncbi:MAG: peroxiredoxin [Bdellovibrionales bacterium]|nr:peroxiredoxin [Bdellovibrionales bacterium]
METLVAKKAPYFEGEAVVGADIKKISMNDYKGKYLCLFFYPLDFTFVCPTELHAFSEKYDEFKKRNCEVLAVSIDSAFSHAAWLRTPKTEGGIQGVKYPILADIHKTVARSYGTLNEEAGVAFRGLFLIDKHGVVQHSLVNNLPLGRNVDEAIRTLDAIQYHEENGEVCPANWHKGEKAMKADQAGLKTYFSK